jgi:hypothetical protein
MRRAVVFAMLAVLAACGASPPRVPAPSDIAGLPAVTVTLDPQIDAERARVFAQQDGAVRLRNAVLNELVDNRRGGGQLNDIYIRVTQFRLRSTGTGVWFGAMAGADTLDVTVTARGETTRTFSTGVSGVAAGLIKPSATGRFNGLVRLAGERIVKKL